MDSTVKAACLAILADFRANIENGRVTSTQDVLTEVTNCMIQVQHLTEPAPPPPPATQSQDVSKFLADLQGKIGRLEDALTGIRSETAEISKEQKENSKLILAAVENGMMNRAPASVAHAAPANSAPASSTPANSAPTSSAPATSKPAVVDPQPATVYFPGGPRTVTIYPPGTLGHKSIICDDRGDVIIDFRRKRPLRREGAFRGLPDEVDYIQMKNVRGRDPRIAQQPVPPAPRWPDQYLDSPCPPSRRSCGTKDLIARQRQLAESMETDEHGRLIPPAYANQLDALAAPAGTTSSPSSSQDSQGSSSSNAESGGISTPSSTTPPSSPSCGRGKKRARAGEDVDALEVQSASGADDEKPAASVKESPQTPASVKREEDSAPEGPAKRRKLRSSAPLKRSTSTRPITRAHTMADISRDS